MRVASMYIQKALTAASSGGGFFTVYQLKRVGNKLKSPIACFRWKNFVYFEKKDKESGWNYMFLVGNNLIKIYLKNISINLILLVFSILLRNSTKT